MPSLWKLYIVILLVYLYFIDEFDCLSANSKQTEVASNYLKFKQANSLSIIIFKQHQRLRKLLKRRKLHYLKFKKSKNKLNKSNYRAKLHRVQKNIKQLRKRLINFKTKTKLKSKSTKNKNRNVAKGFLNLRAAETVRVRRVNKIPEKCKNLKCSQLCSIDANNVPNCYCHRGFTLDLNNRTCLDIDECQFTKCEHKCKNTIGSFTCVCPQGMKLSYDKQTCMDINECFLNNNHGPCQDTCTNTLGSYTCSCDRFKGTKLNKNRHTCEDINECNFRIKEEQICSHDCYNVYNSYFCGCPEGFFLDDDYKNCLDINECHSEAAKTTCTGKCINTIGSFFCLDENTLINEAMCHQLIPLPGEEGYYFCNRNQTSKMSLKGLKERERFLNSPGTICTFYTKLHIGLKSLVCNDRGIWEDFILTHIDHNLNNTFV